MYPEPGEDPERDEEAREDEQNPFYRPEGSSFSILDHFLTIGDIVIDAGIVPV